MSDRALLRVTNYGLIPVLLLCIVKTAYSGNAAAVTVGVVLLICAKALGFGIARSIREVGE